MKTSALSLSLLLVASAAGCESAHSKLDGTKQTGDSAAPSTAPVKADHSGDMETRMRRVEDTLAKNAEALDFLGKVYAQQKQQEQAKAAEEHDPNAMFAVAIADDIKLGKVDGPATAPVTIIKAFDFACPYCQRTAGIMEELVKEYNGKVRVVYKDMVVHPQVATPAHLAACAGAKQGKYQQMKDAIWEKGFLAYSQGGDATKLGPDNLKVIAKDAGLDVAKLEADMKSPECQAMIDGDKAELSKFKVNGTPGFFINGKFIGGALPKEGFKKIVDEQLKIAEASGVSGADYYDKVVLAKGEKQFKSAVQ